MLPLVCEMVTRLFTPERLGELTAQLKAYRNERFAAGDKQTAELANGALVSVEGESEPDCKRLLCALGYLSLLKSLGIMTGPEQEEDPSSDEWAD